MTNKKECRILPPMKKLLILFFVTIFSACNKETAFVNNEEDSLITKSSILHYNLKQKIEEYNNAFKYDSTIVLLQQFKKQANDSLRYICFVLESVTYKRLFKYDEVFRCLDSAELYGSHCKNPNYYLNRIAAERAFALFDIKRYREADSIMKALRKIQFRYVTNQQRGYLIMQEGYLEYKNKNYALAETLYEDAIKSIKIDNSEDLPVIYGKQIQLFLAQKKDSIAFSIYKKALASADSSGIFKYKIYMIDVLRHSFRDRNDYKEVYRLSKIGDSLKSIYNKEEHINKLAELEVKYQTKQKEQALISSRNKQMADERLIAFLISTLVVLLLTIFLVYLLRRQSKAIRERKLHQQFTAQLFEKTEEERKRIAVDLHDGISHDLLQMKESSTSQETSNQIEYIINEIRNISRNLHPAMFERVGLQLSLEQLVERIEQQHDFLISLEMEYEKIFPSSIELQIYRIIQEALNNVLKHAHAHAAYISLKMIDDGLQITIKDNGVGFSVTEKLNSASSFGIHNIIERAEAIGGKAQFESSAQGTIITIKIKNDKNNSTYSR